MQAFDGYNDLHLNLSAYNIGGQGHAYWDYDLDWMGPAQGAYGSANTYHDFRTDDNVDIDYTDYFDVNNCYRSLIYIVYPEWVEYTIEAKYAGDYAFELFSNNSTQFSNILGFTMDGKNCLIDNNGLEQTAVFMPPCHGEIVHSDGYQEWGWVNVRRGKPVSGEKFYIRIPSAGEHKLGIAFLTSSTGLGTLKLMGKPENEGIENLRVQGDKAQKVLIDGDVFIALPGGAIYDARGAQVK